MTKEAMFWERLEGNRGQCHLCAHECRISESNFGVCGVRQNIQGVLHTLVYGRLIAANIDPIEKKPLYHFLPGSISYSIATIGCNFKCGFCQNWQISQASVKEGESVSGTRGDARADRGGCEEKQLSEHLLYLYRTHHLFRVCLRYGPVGQAGGPLQCVCDQRLYDQAGP